MINITTIAEVRSKDTRKPISFKIDFQLPDGLNKACMKVGVRDQTKEDSKNYSCLYAYSMTTLENMSFKPILKALGVFAVINNVDIKTYRKALIDTLIKEFESGVNKGKEINKQLDKKFQNKVASYLIAQ